MSEGASYGVNPEVRKELAERRKSRIEVLEGIMKEAAPRPIEVRMKKGNFIYGMYYSHDKDRLRLISWGFGEYGCPKEILHHLPMDNIKSVHQLIRKEGRE